MIRGKRGGLELGGNYLVYLALAIAIVILVFISYKIFGGSASSAIAAIKNRLSFG